MISRRRLLALLGSVGLFTASTRTQTAPGDEKNSPHGEALSLVWEEKRNEIAALEVKHAKAQQGRKKEYVSPESRWWFDTDDRDWSIKREISPGDLDTTHLFVVTYKLKGKRVALWNVDTKKRSVT